MKFIYVFIMMISFSSVIGQTKQENENDAIEKELELLGGDNAQTNDSTAVRKNKIADTTRLSIEQEIAAEKEQKELLKKMANQRAIELQNALNLSNYVSHMIEKAILKYSIDANKVIQSTLSKQEKSIQLSNIIYFQNEEFKKYMTPQQFYDYINSWPNRQ